jgi:hypothetical protein
MLGMAACGSQAPSQVPATVYVTAVPINPQPAVTAPRAATIPANVLGMNAQALADELTNLGFTNIIFNSDDGRTVLLPENWTVTGVDGAGTAVPVGQDVVIHVHKPRP